MSAKSTSISDLNDDILHLIFSRLITSPSSLHTISSLSRRLNILATRYLYHSPTICLRKNTPHAFYLTLLARPDLRKYVRELEVYFPMEDYPDVHESVDEILELCPELRTFKYQGQPFSPWSDPPYYNPLFLRQRQKEGGEGRCAKLRHVTWKHQISVQRMMDVMLFPGLKSLQVQEVRHLGEMGYPDQDPVFGIPDDARGMSSVEELHVSPIQQLPLQAFPQLLLLPRCLKKLKMDGYGLRFSSREDMDKLLEPVRHSVQELELYNDIGGIQGLGEALSLRGWGQLKRVAVPFRYFVGTAEEFEGRGVVGWLPLSLEEVKFYILETDQAIDLRSPTPDDENWTQTKWLLDLVAAKRTHFPHLRKVILEEQNKSLMVEVSYLLDPVKWRFEKLGVEVRVWKGQGSTY